MRCRFGRVVIMLILCVFAVSCVSADRESSDRGEGRMDMQEAAEHADGILDAVFAEIRPGVQWTHGPTTAGVCDVTRRRVVMTIVSAERRGSLLGLVDRFWRRSHYRIKAVNDDPEVPAIFAQTQDGFGVSLIVGAAGQFFFEVDSPCVRQAEVADPVAKPSGPSYAAAEVIPRPNVHSDFWSTGAS